MNGMALFTWKDWRPKSRKEDVSVEETWRSPLKPGKCRKSIILFSWFQRDRNGYILSPTQADNLDSFFRRKATPYSMGWLHKYLF
ncbi:hypothetical protein PVOR_28414 [Paenibacillus vortex V453]|uniref:Uncharacterized protein n=1 Tax=Paenibacillus vortex V453 TaxID=715225 RepID=A0A2R9SN26_9BACL|nr:hypothetical protein PVOR_28414 [Paenibacillus vortex V453]